jgi:ABC-2 type transport system ATP-binding protein
LRLMADRGTAVLITSHVLDTVERLCTDIVMLHGGKIVLQGKTGSLRRESLVGLPEGADSSLEGLFLRTVAGGARRQLLSFL